MKNFMIIYYAPAELMAQMANVTPEQAAEGMKPWMAWKDKVGDRMVNFGAPLVGGVTVHPNGTSGPCDKEVSGFSIVECENMDEAKSLVADHPHLAWAEGCYIEVYEFARM
jgi:hypothetical protein